MVTDPAGTSAPLRQPPAVLRAVTVVGIALPLFQLYAAGVQPLGLFFQRPIHLGFILVLCFLIYPVFVPYRPRSGSRPPSSSSSSSSAPSSR